MLDRMVRWSPWLGLTGLLTMLVGLCWDLRLHRLSPEATANERLLAPENPGHHLFAAGLALLVVAFCLFLVGRLREGQLGLLSRLGLGGALVAVAGTASLALLMGASVSGGHQHGGAAAAAEVAHASHQEQVSAAPEAHQHAAVPAQASTLPGVHHPHGTGAPITRQELLTAADLVRQVEQAARRYEDVKVAEAEGYRMTTRSFLYHYVNPSYYLDNRVLDVDRIESLVYARGPDGHLKLVGVMFMARPDQTAPDFGGPLTGWHIHDNLCINPTTWMVVALTDSQGRCPAGSVHVVTGEMLHVWLVDTPAGVFADMEQVMPYLLQMGYRPR